MVMLGPSLQVASGSATDIRALGILVNGQADLLSPLWTDRPSLPLAPAYLLEEEITGQSTASKLEAGQLEGSQAIFPVKVPGGFRFDAITTVGPIWQTLRNYGHGTGHGVGFFLNVHEGPHTFNPSNIDVAVEPGTVTSIEPGLYRVGKHGIRIENLVLTKRLESSEFDFANKYLNDHNYVAVYKRQGVDDNVVKVVKPAITPVSVNREDQCRFFEKKLPIDRNQVLFANFNMKQAEVFWHRSSELYNSAVSPTVALFNKLFGWRMGSMIPDYPRIKTLLYSTYLLGQPYKKENHYMVGAYVGTQADKFTEAVTGYMILLN
ncbi:hypothetical protein FQR65_LT16516 [Abscondita terminalis]|nr:hypothetical protein FQR65_LT16516 [Abscondita terminalis]